MPWEQMFGSYRQVTCCPFKTVYKSFLKSLAAALPARRHKTPTAKTNLCPGRIITTLVMFTR